MEQHKKTVTQSPLDTYLAQPEYAEQYVNFLEFYNAYCFPKNEPIYEIEKQFVELPHMLCCGMTPDHKTIVLRSTDGPDLRYLLVSHDFTSGDIEHYTFDHGNPIFSTDMRRFQFGASPLILTINATTTNSADPIHFELTSQGCNWTQDGKQQELNDIQTLTQRVDHIRQHNP